MGTYSTQEFMDTFGGMPEPGETYGDPDLIREQAEEHAERCRCGHHRRIDCGSLFVCKQNQTLR